MKEKQQIKHSDYILTIKEFWSPSQCEDFIAKSEALGYEQAKVQTESGEKLVEAVRNNQRVLFKDRELAAELWLQVKPFVLSKLGNSIAIGLNEMFRFYKYQAGEEFKKHRDQSFIRNESESSYFTFIIYLNEGFLGGETEFKEVKIIPKTGDALLFFHDLEHSGNPIEEGAKYLLRTDVMYRLE